MTILLASLIGAALFFAAGAAAATLRRSQPVAPELAAPVPIATELIAVVPSPERGDVDALRRELADARRRERTASEDLAVLKADLARLRIAVDTAERTVRNARSDLDVERAATVAVKTELARLKANPIHDQETTPHARSFIMEQQLRERAERDASRVRELSAENERLEARVADAEKLTASVTDAAARVKALIADNEQLEARVAEIEREATARTRELATENEQLRGRVADAEALRADYVRLRTAVSETAFLKAEIRRLEEQVRTVRRESLGGGNRRPPRASSRLLPAGSIAASLAGALERFAEPTTRSSAVADPQGFPLATAGDDGQALAAYAALAIAVGDKATELLPLARPAAIEIVDERGARIAVWTFESDHERLVLANLSVAPVEAGRVESALADLTGILATGPRA